jgi:hypothetical protein
MSQMKLRRKRTRSGARTTNKTRELPRLKRLLKEHLPFLMDRYHVKTIGVFGSYVRGEQKAKSDLDILVEFSETPSMFEFLELEEHLSNILSVKVDLVVKSALKLHIGQHILREVVTL